MILVTGGGGFLGGHIVRRLRAEGRTVRVLGRRAYPWLEKDGVECVRGDVADPEAVRTAVAGCQAVVHTAAIPGVWGEYNIYHDANYLGTKHVVDCAREAGVDRLVYTSTPSVVHGGQGILGGDETLPYPRGYLTPYAATKALAEQLVLAANGPAFRTAAIRPHLIYGPGDTQLIPKLLSRAKTGKLIRVGDGRNLVSVSYVENVADAHVAALASLGLDGPAAGQAYFINEPEPVNLWDFIGRILAGMGFAPVTRSIPYRLAYAAGWLMEKAGKVSGRREDPRLTRFLASQLATSHWFRVDKARRDLGWEPRVPFEEGFSRMLDDLRYRYGTGTGTPPTGQPSVRNKDDNRDYDR